MESPEKNPHLPGQLIYDKWGNGGKIISLTNCVGKSGQIHAKESNLITVLHCIQKVKLKLIRELNISAETINS